MPRYTPTEPYANSTCLPPGVRGHDIRSLWLKNQIESLIRKGIIKCTPAPPNVNNNPLPNHQNQKVCMVTLDDEYGTPDYPNTYETDAMTSSAHSVITVQLKEPLTVQTYLPRAVVTTLIAKEPDHPIHSVNSIQVTDELDGAICHTLEIMQAIRVNEGAELGDTKLSSAAKMVLSEMLKYGYQPKKGLGPKSNGILEPIQLKHQRGTNKLGYEPASRRDCHGSTDTIFVAVQALIPNQVGVNDIVEGIGNLML
ncbi:hypothetical protein H5410_048399 [Solanum commersonii]|uniref:G-patch domain-containing protein n=1 Tax=Solanum commersonii TaxID=4109 RepID=A0A9J5XJK9_SOLCO|nr:hypothetical protein H5410_048399 [Solanum commersonii]